VNHYVNRYRRVITGIVAMGIATSLIASGRPVAAYSAPVSTSAAAARAAIATAVASTPHTQQANGMLLEALSAPAATETPTATPTAAPTGDAGTSVQIGTGPFAFSVDLGDWIAKLFAGTWKALGVDGIKAFGDQIAGWLLRNPDLATSAGQMGNVQRMTDTLRLAAVSVCIALFAAGVYRVWLGGEAPVSSLGRLLAVLVTLGFYRTLVGWIVGATNALTDGVLHAGMNATPSGFGALLAAIPGTSPVWALAGVIALVFLFVLGVVRLLGYAFLLVAYVLGPIVLPLSLVPETAGYCGLWAKHGAKLLVWPVLWAVEFRLFDALKEGLYLPDSVPHAVLAPFAAIGMLIVMWKTPLMLHSGSFEQGTRAAVRVVRVAAGAAATAFSGGAASPVAGSAARGAGVSGMTGTTGAMNASGSAAMTTTQFGADVRSRAPRAGSDGASGTVGSVQGTSAGQGLTDPRTNGFASPRGGQS